MTPDLLRSFNVDFDDLVAGHGERLALISAVGPDAQFSYAELDELIDRHLSWLATHNLGAGDSLGVVLPNSIESLVLFLASIRGGLRFAPLACDSTPAELQRWLRVVQPDLCVFDSLLGDAMASAIGGSTRRAVPIQIRQAFPYLATTAPGVAWRSDNAKVLLFTSGTTGLPKAIVLDSDRLWSAGRAFLNFQGIDTGADFRIWNYLPQSYLGGLFNMGLIPLSVGGCIVVDESFTGASFLRFWQTIDRYDINVLWLVPSIVRGLLSLGRRSRSTGVQGAYSHKVWLALLGTAPIERAVKQEFHDVFGIRLLESYGLSETTFVSAETSADEPSTTEGYVGRVLPYVEVRLGPQIQDEAGVASELHVRSPFLMDGYATEDGYDPGISSDGFFPTGDIGDITPDGHLVLMGRTRDVIKKGGQLVALREAEVVAVGHPSVLEAVAVPISHDFYGESYRILVQLQPDASEDSLDFVREHIFESLAKYKWPETVEVVAELPRTQSGKPRRIYPAASS